MGAITGDGWTKVAVAGNKDYLSKLVDCIHDNAMIAHFSSASALYAQLNHTPSMFPPYIIIQDSALSLRGISDERIMLEMIFETGYTGKVFFIGDDGARSRLASFRHENLFVYDDKQPDLADRMREQIN